MRSLNSSFLLLIFLVTFQFIAKSSNATILRLPPANWIIQNTESIRADDITILTLLPMGPLGDFDRGRSSSGTSFPNLEPRNFGNVITFTAPPGLPSGGFYGLSFSGWPGRSAFNIEFSYDTDNDPTTLRVLRSPGRVYRQVSSGLFEFAPSLSLLSFAPIPANFIFSSNRAIIVQVSEPGTIVLMGLGLVGLLGFGRHQH